MLKKIFYIIIFSFILYSCQSSEIIVKRDRSYRFPELELITENYLDLWEMVLVPEGNFTMGSNSSFPDESPEHQVYLKDFYIDKYEVTNFQYAIFCQQTGHPVPQNWSGGICPQSKYYEPVIWISYQDALDYANWIGKQLPSEEQWEKAARGIDSRNFPWGNDWIESACRTMEEEYDIPQLIGWYGNRGQSPYGVIDIAGNVWEWTSTWYNRYPGSSAESGYFGSIVKVIRGGSYKNTKELASVSYRGIHYPNIPTSHIGFRCVYVPDDMDILPSTIHFESNGIIEW